MAGAEDTLQRKGIVMLLRKLLLTVAALTLTASLAIAQPAYITQWGSAGSANGQFDLPWGVAVNPNTGEVFVADQNNHRIQVFDGNGSFLRSFGSFGTGPGQLNLPYGIMLDAAGNVYVTEIGNNRVQKFASGGASLMTFGSLGSGNGQFNTPSGILSHSSGAIFVSDGLNHRVQKFDAAGNFVSAWGSYGSPTGMFRIPMGIGEDSDGNIYIADQGNHRVQKFNASGTFLLQFGQRGLGDLDFSFPQDVVIDGNDAVYVTDMANHRVKIYDTLGNWIVNFGSQGTGDGQFNYPLGIGVDAGNNVYVAELDNSRIQKFGPPAPPAPPAAAARRVLDVIPGTYPNVIESGSDALVSIALLGGPELDVANLKTATVRLHGRAPYLMAIGDVSANYAQVDDCHTWSHGADGIDDVIFRFRTSDILTALPAWKEGETRMLTLTGEFKDGTTFSASDCVILKEMPTEHQGSEVVDLAVQPRNTVRRTTAIEYSVPEAIRVQLSVYDVTGRRLTTLVDDWVPSGRHQLEWNSAGIPSGVYFVRMDVGGQTITRRVALQQ